MRKKILILLIVISIVGVSGFFFAKSKAPLKPVAIKVLNQEVLKAGTDGCNIENELSKRPVLDPPLSNKINSTPTKEEVVSAIKYGIKLDVIHIVTTHKGGERYSDFIGDRCRYLGEALYKYSDQPGHPTFSLFTVKDNYSAPLYIEVNYQGISCIGPDYRYNGELSMLKYFSIIKRYEGGCKKYYSQSQVKAIDLDHSGSNFCENTANFSECSPFNKILLDRDLNIVKNAQELISKDPTLIQGTMNKCNVDGSMSGAPSNMPQMSGVETTNQGAADTNPALPTTEVSPAPTLCKILN